MRFTVFLLAAAGVIGLTARGPNQVANPSFDGCAGDCAQAHSRCMTPATSLEVVTRCNAQQATCVTRCEARHPRLIPQEKKQ